mgnify:CR=1 FL=1
MVFIFNQTEMALSPTSECSKIYPIAEFDFDQIQDEEKDELRAWYTKNCIDAVF